MLDITWCVWQTEVPDSSTAQVQIDPLSEHICADQKVWKEWLVELNQGALLGAAPASHAQDRLLGIEDAPSGFLVERRSVFSVWRQ